MCPPIRLPPQRPRRPPIQPKTRERAGLRGFPCRAVQLAAYPLAQQEAGARRGRGNRAGPLATRRYVHIPLHKAGWLARNLGFTLMEMLVALTVFAVIGLLSAQLMGHTIGNHERLGERSNRVTEAQRAMLVLKRDITQLARRPVRDMLGDPRQAVLIGNDGLMEFSKFGWRNPLRQPRAEVQRVAYLVRDGDLYRAWWRVLDRAPDSEPALQKLLTDIEQIEFFALDASGQEHNYWPLLGEDAEHSDRQLVAILMRLEFAPFGVVERIWPVPAF